MQADMDNVEDKRIRSGSRNREAPVGILRLDAGKPRRASAEFKHLAKEPVSPQPSIDRLSVTFADESKVDSPRLKQFNTFPTQPVMDKVQFTPVAADEENSDEDDYSASVSKIIQRRASTKRSRRRNSRRASSPFSPDILPGSENGRRRSSVYTTSSGDTAITMDDCLPPETSQDQIFENIRIHKEVLSSVKMQPWNMRKKLRLVVQAKTYIKKHQGALQERLAQSHSTRDILARWNLIFVQKLQYIKRETANLTTWFTPWELRIKEIESHFGSVVASYFIFLRWLFWVNLVISSIIIAFVTVPELLTADPSTAGDRKGILKEDKYNATNFVTLWDFEGVLKYSPLFYGWYTNRDGIEKGYRLPFAYFMTGLAVYTYSFVATLRKMAKNSRSSKLSEKEDECVFSWKLFTGWDYMIGNPETAHNRVASIVMSFKEALLEEAEKKKERRNWKIIGLRILVNLVVIGLLVLSALAVIEVVRRSAEPEAKSTIWRANEVTVVMTLISMAFPMLFEVLGFFEQYHPRKQLRIQLARIMVLNLLNLYSLIFALYDKIDDMTIELKSFKRNGTPIPDDSELISTTSSYVTTHYFAQQEFLYNATNCFKICTTPSNMNMTSEDLLENIIATITTTALAKIFSLINVTTTESSNTTLLLTLPTNFTELFDNSSTISTPSPDNATEIEDSVTDFNYALTDYLYSLLANFSANATTESNTTVFNNASDGYEELKSTLVPYLNLTEFDETNLSQIYNDISSTVATILAKNTTPGANCQVICPNISDITTTISPVNVTLLTENKYELLDYANKSRLRSLCWETMFGQELMKLTIMDFVMTVVSTLGMDFLRGLFTRYFNKCWCWDLEKRFPQYGDFKVAENILHLVNNQGNVWMGMFFSPGLALINVVKLYLIMYLRSWTVLTCNVPHEIIFRASRSNNFYFALLLMMLFLCVLPVGYAIVWVEPSWHCGPFSNYSRIFHIFTITLRKAVPKTLHKALDYIASPGIVIPLLVLLILIIYYLVSLTNALRETNNDLKIQLRRERTEERRKMFQIADRRRRGGSEGSSDAQNPFSKWKKLLQTMPSGKSLDETPKDSENAEQSPKEDKMDPDKKAFLSKFLRRALNRSSVDDDEGTDNEQTDSLPDDANVKEEKKPEVVRKPFSMKPRGSSFKQAINAAVLQKRNSKADMAEVKHVKISDSAAPAVHVATKKPEKSTKKKHETRQDSQTSNWSDNIPVITISKTESEECILENSTVKIEKTAKIIVQEDQKDVIESEKNECEEVNTNSSSKKHVLKKQSSEVEADDFEEISIKSYKKKVDSENKSSTSGSGSAQTSSETTKTESSGEYKEDYKFSESF